MGKVRGAARIVVFDVSVVEDFQDYDVTLTLLCQKKNELKITKSTKDQKENFFGKIVSGMAKTETGSRKGKIAC